MLETIDTLFERGFRIVDVGISRIVGINGMEKKIDGKYPSISKDVKLIKESGSNTWLLCKWNQLNKTDFNNIDETKAIFEGMYKTKVGEVEYHQDEDLYTLVVFTYTKTITGAITKERVKLWLASTLEVTATPTVKVESDNDKFEF